MARITRKELKSDKFAQEVGLTVTFFEEHQKDVVRYGGIGVAVVLLIGGFFVYQRHERTARQEALWQAIRIEQTPVATASSNGQQTFPTQDAKDQAGIKAFSDLASSHSGSNEGEIASYYLGTIHTDQNKLDQAEKDFQEVVNHGDKDYASLANFSLAQLYLSQGKSAQGEKILRDLMANPTVFVSKEQAALTLAQHFATSNPAEARKLLAPIKDGKSQVASLAQTMYAQLPQQ